MGAATAAAVGVYFLDPQSGRRRRAIAIDRARALVRRGGRRSERAARAAGAEAYGAGQRLTHPQSQQQPPPDDVTLTRKVETEIFRGADVPKGQINVNAVDGVVTLRGQARRPEEIRALEEQTRTIPGVRDVENLLHLPDTEAPHSATDRRL